MLHELYFSLCVDYSVSPDFNVYEALVRKSETVKISTDIQGCILLDLLKRSQREAISHFKHLVFTAPELSWSTLMDLSAYLKDQTHLSHLDLRCVKVGDSGIGILLRTLSNNSASPITHLNLASVGLSSAGAISNSHFLSKSLGALTHLDLSNNAANQRGVSAISNALQSRHKSLPRLYVQLDGNLINIEVLNAVTHGLGAGGALLGGVVMLMRAIENGLRREEVASLVVFIASLFILMTSSCVYHSCFRMPYAFTQTRKADHCCIFLLIAGSYTPFVVCYTLHPPLWAGPVTLITVWICATVGIVRSVAGAGSSRTRALLALGTGWLGVFATRSLMERIQVGALWCILMGGLAYSIGVAFYFLGLRRPMMHVIWHVAVIIGGSFHYFALWKYVVNAR